MKSSDNAPRVLFEDRHLLILAKPAGWLAQADAGSPLPDLESWSGDYRQQSEGKSGPGFVKAGHRIDAPVTGIVCLAKTSKALARLHESQKEGRWYKFYVAFVSPCPRQTAAELHHWIAQRDGKAALVSPASAEGKEARLRYQVLRQAHDRALLGIELFTGRYHQIRCQLAATGSPILADRKYGSREPPREEGIALHAAGLAFPHPIGGATVWVQHLPDWAPLEAKDWIEQQRALLQA
jgi:23S rRNA pseudouridine1911/1915/1917 synthase